jgi:RHS repeat-associated protein
VSFLSRKRDSLGSGSTVIKSLTWTYDADGRVATAGDDGSSYTMSYNTSGYLSQVVSNIGSGTGHPSASLNYFHDPFGNYLGFSEGSSNSVSYTYDSADRLASAALTASGTTAMQSFTYDNADRVTAESRHAGIFTTPNISTALTYDNANRLTDITHTSSSAGTLSEFTYTYDDAGRITEYVGPEGTVDYSYDNTNQLTGASGARSESYSYDANGNRSMTGYTTGTGNRLTSDGTYSYTYDNEGNMLTKSASGSGETDYTWDYRNRLTDVKVKNSSGTVITEDVFTYDIFDRRVKKSYDPDGAGSTAPTVSYTIYDGANPYVDFLEVHMGPSTLYQATKHYLYALTPDSLIANIGTGNGGTTSGAITWYLADNIGSIRQMVQTNGTVLDALNYDSFGIIAYESSSTNADRFKFTAREWDGEIGLYYYRARYYGPGVGRFVSEDPLSCGSADVNLYRYVNGTVLLATDPTGMILDPHGATMPRPAVPPGVLPYFGTPSTWIPPAPPFKTCVDISTYIIDLTLLLKALEKKLAAATVGSAIWKYYLDQVAALTDMLKGLLVLERICIGLEAGMLPFVPPSIGPWGV